MAGASLNDWICDPCGEGMCLRCDRWLGCEHVADLVDGRLILCAGMWQPLPKPREG